MHSHLEWGGIEVWLTELLERLEPGSFRFDFLASQTDPSFLKRIEAAGGKVYAAPPLRSFGSYIKRFRQVLARYGPYDIVHSHFVDHSGVLLAQARLLGVPVRIAHSHVDLAPVSRDAGVIRSAYFRMNQRWIRQ